MSNQSSRKNPLEDQIIEEIAKMVANEMTAEIRNEVSVQLDQLPIISSKVRQLSINCTFQERLAQRLAHRQEQIAEQIIWTRRHDTNVIPAGGVRAKILARNEQTMLDKEGRFRAHVLKCALLSSRIEVEKKAFEGEDERIVERVGREMEGVLRRDGERWMNMSKVSESEFEKEWEEEFDKEA